MGKNNHENLTQKTTDEYLEELLNESQDNFFSKTKIEVDKSGLVELRNDDFEIRKHGFIIDETLFFSHTLLRRYGTSNFVSINLILKKHIFKGNKVKLRLDPFMMKNAVDYEEILEHDHFFGPNFSEEMLNETENFNDTLHYTDSVDLNGLTYPVKYTIFRPSWLDREIGQLQYYVEELLLPTSIYYSGKRYKAQKYIHFVYDRINQRFIHIDGSVRVFKVEEYNEIFTSVDSHQKIYPQHIPGIKRFKLFQIDGVISFGDISEIFSDFLMYNNHIDEYFSNLNE